MSKIYFYIKKPKQFWLLFNVWQRIFKMIKCSKNIPVITGIFKYTPRKKYFIQFNICSSYLMKAIMLYPASYTNNLHYNIFAPLGWKRRNFKKRDVNHDIKTKPTPMHYCSQFKLAPSLVF